MRNDKKWQNTKWPSSVWKFVYIYTKKPKLKKYTYILISADSTIRGFYIDI